ncbi:signal peptidase II [Oscillospiraceae bacterium 38-13]
MLFTVLSALLALALLGLDQLVKLHIAATLPLGESRPLLPGLVELRTVHNYGAAWSSFSGMRWLLVIATSCIVLALLTLLVRRVVRHPLGVLAGCLIISGGLGNILDRVRLGYVVDMFNFQFINYPVFNVADMCIVSGCVLGLIYYQWFYEKYDKKGAPDGNADSSGSGV